MHYHSTITPTFVAAVAYRKRDPTTSTGRRGRRKMALPASTHTARVNLLVFVEEGDHVGTVGGLLKAHKSHVGTWAIDGDSQSRSARVEELTS